MVIKTQINSIKNSAIKVGADDNRDYPKALFKPHFTLMVSGKTGSGKSNAILNMLKQYDATATFQKRILISPTAMNDLKYHTSHWDEVYDDYSDELLSTLVQQQKEDIEEFDDNVVKIALAKRFFKCKPAQIATEFNQRELKLLSEMLDQEGDLHPPTQKFDQRPFAVVLMDDLGGTNAYRQNNSTINSIICKSRHYLMNFVLCCQHPYQIPRACRSQISHLIIFHNRDKTIMKEIAKENCDNVSPEEFLDLFETATADPHSFLLCDFKTGEFRQNFDTKLTVDKQKSVDT